MNAIIWEVGEFVYMIVFIIWLSYHALEYVWVIITHKSPDEMNTYINRLIMSFKDIILNKKNK